MRYYLVVLGLLVFAGLPWCLSTYPAASTQFISSVGTEIQTVGSQLAAVIFAPNPVTVADLQTTYSNANTPSSPKVRVLIVPGHEPDYGGAEYASPFGDILERNLTVQLGQDLQTLLNNDNHYQVTITRDTQAWTPTFANYFQNDWNDIVAWEQAHKQATADLIKTGQFTVANQDVDHIDAVPDVAMRIYGIDKWADDNNMDIVIHIHFNDYPGHGSNPGKYNGFAIYVPQDEYANSTTTYAVAQTVFKRLAKYNPVSNFAGEKTGIVPDQDLIAIGAYNSVNAASMLIEYSYIYEPQLDNPATQATFVKELAYETYRGLQDFFDPTNTAGYDTQILPYTWTTTFGEASSTPADDFALQTALINDSDYPPQGKTLNDCPRTGGFGACTKAAVDEFQQKYGITGETDEVGPQTLNKLNGLFGPSNLFGVGTGT